MLRTTISTLLLLLVSPLALLAVGCNDTPDAAQPSVSGPALVLFYTDN